MENDTIAAIATPYGVGGIGVIRLSGPEAIRVAERMVRLSHGRQLSEMEGYTCAYGRVFDGDGEIDEAVLTLFRAPRSYTGEDVVEIAAHGGIYLLERILRACCLKGARPAQAGEFTRRAFLNGKLDLTQAEAVADLISARGRQAARAALTARDGALYREAERICGELTGYAAHLAAWIDYPEEEIVEVDQDALAAGLCGCMEALEKLSATYDTGRVIREGIDTAIVGRPNVGKSTLMNLLSGFQRSIVSNSAGTTRDVVSDTVQLGDLMLHLSDTAGIRSTDDPIERQGVQMAHDRLARAQLVLAVFDGSEPLDADDLLIAEACKEVPVIALVNKRDLPRKMDLEPLKQRFERLLVISADQPDDLELLKREIEQLFSIGSFDAGAATVANERQRGEVRNACEEVRQAVDALSSGVSYDAVCVCIEAAIDALLSLTGKRASEQVVQQVFSRFCVGK